MWITLPNIQFFLTILAKVLIGSDCSSESMSVLGGISVCVRGVNVSRVLLAFHDIRVQDKKKFHLSFLANLFASSG